MNTLLERGNLAWSQMHLFSTVADLNLKKINFQGRRPAMGPRPLPIPPPDLGGLYVS